MKDFDQLREIASALADVWLDACAEKEANQTNGLISQRKLMDILEGYPRRFQGLLCMTISGHIVGAHLTDFEKALAARAFRRGDS